MTEHRPQDDSPEDNSVVKKGGIASDAEAADVTRDTYGFTEDAQEGDDASKEEARRRLEDILPTDDAER